MMDKEEILAKSRTENKSMDEYEKSVLDKAGKISVQAGLLLCCLIAILEVIFTGKASMGSWTIYFGMLTTQFLVKYSKLRQKHELLVTAFYGVLFLFFLIFFIKSLIG